MVPDFISLQQHSSLPGLFTESPEPVWTQQWREFYQLELAATMPGLEQRLGRIRVLNYDLAVQYLIPANAHATLLVLHGYYDHMGLYGHLFRWALNNGFAVVSCDLPGHGLSSGSRASIGEFAEYRAALDALFIVAQRFALPRPWHLAGQSMGGAVALDYALNQQSESEQLGRLILFAPLVRPRAWRKSRMLYLGLRPFVQQVPRIQTINSSDQMFVDFLRRDPMQTQVLPTAWVGALSRWIERIEQVPAQPISPIIIQGNADMTVDWRHNLAVLDEKFQSPQLCMLPGAGHHLVNEQEHYRRKSFDFIERSL